MTSPSAPGSSAWPRMRQHDAGHLVGDGDGLVACNELRLRQVALAHDLAGAQRALGRQADGLLGVGDDVGGRTPLFGRRADREVGCA